MSDKRHTTNIYLDYQATTPLDPEVVAIVSDTLTSAWGNPSSRHSNGLKARSVIAEARHWVAKMIGADTDDIIFNSGGTEGNNTVLHSALHFYHSQNEIQGCAGKRLKIENGAQNCSRRPHIVTSNIEHDSIEKVLRQFELQGLADVTYVPVNQISGRVEVEDVIRAVNDNTCLVTLMLANNETGIIMPIEEISRALSELQRPWPVLLHTDAAQAIGKIPVNVKDLGAHYLTIVGHKFYGPRIGALYVKNIANNETPYTPMFYGGGQERNFRSGTENTPMIAGLGKAAELVCRNLSRETRQLEETRGCLDQLLQEKFGDKLHFNARYEGTPRIPNVCNVSIEGPCLNGKAVLEQCERLQASVGAACHSGGKHRASPVLLRSGVPEHLALNAIRLCVGRNTTHEDVKVAVLDLKHAVEKLQKNTPVKVNSGDQDAT